MALQFRPSKNEDHPFSHRWHVCIWTPGKDGGMELGHTMYFSPNLMKSRTMSKNYTAPPATRTTAPKSLFRSPEPLTGLPPDVQQLSSRLQGSNTGTVLFACTQTETLTEKQNEQKKFPIVSCYSWTASSLEPSLGHLAALSGQALKLPGLRHVLHSTVMVCIKYRVGAAEHWPLSQLTKGHNPSFLSTWWNAMLFNTWLPPCRHAAQPLPGKRSFGHYSRSPWHSRGPSL